MDSIGESESSPHTKVTLSDLLRFPYGVYFLVDCLQGNLPKYFTRKIWRAYTYAILVFSPYWFLRFFIKKDSRIQQNYWYN